MARHKRRNFFINKDYQGKVILSTLLFFLGGSLLFIGLLTVFSYDSLTTTYSDSNINLGGTPFMLLKRIVTANWLFLVFGGIVLAISSMLISHRIAGPMFRLEKALDHMNSGDLGEMIRLRAKDEGKPLAAKINQFNATLSTSVRSLNYHTDALEALLDQLEALNLNKEEKDEIASLCWAIREHNRKVRAAFSNYIPKADD